MRRNLVFARVGESSLHPRWIQSASSDRSWDLQLSAFGTKAHEMRGGDLPLSIDFGTKWDSVFRYFKQNPDLLDRYEYIFFPDDDLIFGDLGIDRLFEVTREHDLSLSQPALTVDSYYSYAITLRCSRLRLRYTNFIELMAPCFRASYLKMILPNFQNQVTGWGMDRIWALLMKDPAYRAGIIDATPVTHTRPIGRGTTYAAFEALGADPWRDLGENLARYRNVPRGLIVYGAVSNNGRLVRGSLARLLNGIELLRIAPSSQDWRVATWSALGMFARVVTQAHYLPEELQEAVTFASETSPSIMERWPL